MFILFYFLSLLCAFKERKWSLIISFISLLVVAGFREQSVGTDTKNYESLFDSYGTETDMMYHAKEPLYLLLHYCKHPTPILAV